MRQGWRLVKRARREGNGLRPGTDRLPGRLSFPYASLDSLDQTVAEVLRRRLWPVRTLQEAPQAKSRSFVAFSGWRAIFRVQLIFCEFILLRQEFSFKFTLKFLSFCNGIR
jgi:hypothetical protein